MFVKVKQMELLAVTMETSAQMIFAFLGNALMLLMIQMFVLCLVRNVQSVHIALPEAVLLHLRRACVRIRISVRV
jgi:hypothetical protein